MDDLKILSGRDKDRMQRDLFYPDLCTSKKYVAFVDTDTMLISRMVPEMLFDGGKPIVIGVYGKVVHSFYNRIAQATAKLFKTKEVIRCMSYFPVVMKVEHLVELREYLEKLHNIPFDRAVAAYLKVVRRKKPFHAEGTRGGEHERGIILPLVRGVRGPPLRNFLNFERLYVRFNVVLCVWDHNFSHFGHKDISCRMRNRMLDKTVFRHNMLFFFSFFFFSMFL